LNTPAILPDWPNPSTMIGGLMAAGITLATVSGNKLLFITTDRAAVFALVIIGFAMCVTGGSGRAIGAYGITHPITITGAALGILALLVTASVLFGFRLPLIADDRAAVYAIATIIVVKMVINFVFAWIVR
jgi:hypothetical protein